MRMYGNISPSVIQSQLTSPNWNFSLASMYLLSICWIETDSALFTIPIAYKGC